MEENNTTVDNGDDDRTIDLPDELTFIIFSFLPYASVSSTKLVCRRWYELWSGIAHRQGTIGELERTINDFLENINACDPSNHPWRLHYRCNTDDDHTLLQAKVSGNWGLDLDFSSSENTTPNWPYHLTLEMNKDIVVNPTLPPLPNPNPKLSFSPSFYVKTLHLNSVTDLTSTVVSSIVSSFHLLQNLHIEGCKSLRSLRLSSKKLQQLTIFDCLQLKTLRINAPNLEGFRYRGGRPWFVATGMDVTTTKLADAMLDFRRGNHSKYIGCNPQLLISCLMKLRRLTLCRGSYEEILTSKHDTDGLNNMNMKMFKFDELEELCWIDNSMDSHRADILLCFLTVCPSLEKLQITIDPTCSSLLTSFEKRFHRLTTGAANNGLPKLKLVELTGCLDDESESSLVEAISDYATATDLTIIRSS